MEINRDRVSAVLDEPFNHEILADIMRTYRLRTGAGPATASEVLKATIAIEDVTDRLARGVVRFGSRFEDLRHIAGPDYNNTQGGI